MTDFDFEALAVLYPGRGGRRDFIGYRRFPSAALALRYAIEDMPRVRLDGAMLEVNEDRYDKDQMLELYLSAGYPLPRNAGGAYSVTISSVDGRFYVNVVVAGQLSAPIGPFGSRSAAQIMAKAEDLRLGGNLRAP